jgi:hypothetical protein
MRWRRGAREQQTANLIPGRIETKTIAADVLSLISDEPDAASGSRSRIEQSGRLHGMTSGHEPESMSC